MDKSSSSRISRKHWITYLLDHRSRNQHLRIAGLTGLRIIVGICDLLLAAAMYVLFLVLQGGAPVRQIWWMPRTTLAAALLAAFLGVLRSILDVLSTRAVVGHVQKIYAETVLRLTRGYTAMRWSSFVDCNRSELLNLAVNTAREGTNLYHLSIELLATVVVVVAMTGALIYRSPGAACGLILTGSAFYVVQHLLVRKKLLEAGWQKERSLRDLQRWLADILECGKEIRTYTNQDFFYGRIREQVHSVAHESLRLMVLPQVSRILSDQGVVLAFLGVVIAVAMHHGDVRELLSLLAFYFVLSRRLLPLVSQVSFIASQMEAASQSMYLVSEQIAECDRRAAPVRPRHLPDAGFVLVLEQVSFAFDQGPMILQHLDLWLRMGEIVVIRGVSGSGKSTLLNLVAGITQPSTGMVLVDPENIAYVPQDVVLFDDSIRNNLLFGLSDKSDNELIEALVFAKLHEFVTSQPLGLETRVGNNGILFSGGERQRLGLARAILRGPKLLLLDEGTSALDEHNEAVIMGNLSTCGIAVLLVTHRISGHSFPHRVLELDNGRLILCRAHALDHVS